MPQLSLADAAVVVAMLFYGLQGMRLGLARAAADLASLAASLLLALTLYEQPAQLAGQQTGIALALVRPVVFLVLWIGSDIVLQGLTFALLRRSVLAGTGGTVNTVLGLFPGAAKGLLLAALWLTLALVLPVPDAVKSEARAGSLAAPLAEAGSGLSRQFSTIFGDAALDTIGRFSLRPAGHERIQLPFRVAQPRTDPTAEEQMLALVNVERKRVGLRPLVMDSRLRQIARQHSAEMFQDGYFGHQDQAGGTAADRAREDGVRAQLVGENIALAPNLEAAHRGLMESEGHRENILSPSYGRVGIGVLDGGLRGKMFTQDFAD